MYNTAAFSRKHKSDLAQTIDTQHIRSLTKAPVIHQLISSACGPHTSDFDLCERVIISITDNTYTARDSNPNPLTQMWGSCQDVLTDRAYGAFNFCVLAQGGKQTLQCH